MHSDQLQWSFSLLSFTLTVKKIMNRHEMKEFWFLDLYILSHHQ